MNEETWSNFCDEACEAARVGNLDKAEHCWREAWALAQTLPSEDPRRITTMEYLADTLCMRLKFHDAEPIMTELFNVQSRLMGEYNLKSAAMHNRLAGLFYVLKKYDQAEGHCKRALDINEKIYGPENSDVAMVLHNLAMVYHAQSRFQDAEIHYLRALEITGQVLGLEHPETVSVAEHYSGLLDAMGRKDEAEKCSKTRVLPLLDRLVRTVGEEEQPAAPSPTAKGFSSSTLQGIERDPRRSNQCMYRITPLPPLDEAETNPVD